MARKKEVYKVGPMTAGKKNIIVGLLQEYDIQDALKDLLGGTLQSMLQAEMDEWQHRPLHEVYPIVFIDAVHFSVKDNNIILKLAAYVILGINSEVKKEVYHINSKNSVII